MKSAFYELNLSRPIKIKPITNFHIKFMGIEIMIFDKRIRQRISIYYN